MKRLGSGFGGSAGGHAPWGNPRGSLKIGRDPISCSSKHSSAIGFVTTLPVSLMLPQLGRETVAELWCDWSKVFLLAESTVVDFGGDTLRPVNLYILSCHSSWLAWCVCDMARRELV